MPTSLVMLDPLAGTARVRLHVRPVEMPLNCSDPRSRRGPQCALGDEGLTCPAAVCGRAQQAYVINANTGRRFIRAPKAGSSTHPHGRPGYACPGP
jgi:hypothetical protein